MKDIIILYGSETGNSEELSKRLKRNFMYNSSSKFSIDVTGADEYVTNRLTREHTKVIIIVSTAGQGQAPEGFKKTWNWLNSMGHSANLFQHLSIAVFGLGDSGYENFNVVAKKVQRCFNGLGARTIVDIGLGDDQMPNYYEYAFENWRTILYDSLYEQIPGLLYPPGPETTPIQSFGRCKFSIRATGFLMPSPKSREEALKEAYITSKAFNELNELSIASEKNTSSNKFKLVEPTFAPVCKNLRLTSPKQLSDVRHVELDIKESSAFFNPGDLVHIIPWVEETVMETFWHRIMVNPSQEILIELNSEMLHTCHFSGKMRCRTGALWGVLDVLGKTPRKVFFRIALKTCFYRS
jgi:sulfite reductase alpha subunit-like flavoprotein